MLASSLIPVVLLIVMFNRNPEENSVLEGWILTTALIIMAFTLALMWYLKLKTEVNAYHIYVHYFPFITTKSYQWQDIEYAELVNYGFVGGWGVRFFTKYGTLYNVKGKMGLAFKLKSGKKICIGTQRPEEMRRILAQLPAIWQEMDRSWGREKLLHL